MKCHEVISCHIRMSWLFFSLSQAGCAPSRCLQDFDAHTEVPIVAKPFCCLFVCLSITSIVYIYMCTSLSLYLSIYQYLSIYLSLSISLSLDRSIYSILFYLIFIYIILSYLIYLLIC